MLRAEREHDGVVGGRRLQLEIERAAKPFSQRQPPRAVQPDTERGVYHQLHAARLVEEPFHDDLVLRRD